jgi:hypothetical protein
LPIGYGRVASVADATLVSVVFRPELAELFVLAMLLLVAVALEGPSWFVFLVLGFYHLGGCVVGFGPAVDDISAALEAALRTKHPEPPELRGAAEQGDEADQR